MNHIPGRHENMHPPSTVSIIIRTYNEARHIGQALRAIQCQTQPISEVVVVDSGSEDATVRIAKGEGARVIRIPKESFSYGRALNAGFSSSSSDMLVSLSAHAMPRDAHWLETLTKPFADPNVAAVSSRILPYPASSVEALLLSAPFVVSGRRLRNRVHLLWNTSAAYRREVWRLLPFDECIRACEDREWAIRARSVGYDIIYEPSSVVMHYHVESGLRFAHRGFNSLVALAQIYIRNRIWLCSKEGHQWLS